VGLKETAALLPAGTRAKTYRLDVSTVIDDSARVLDVLPRPLPVRYGAILRRLRGL
jgi:hypothetical protein